MRLAKCAKDMAVAIASRMCATSHPFFRHRVQWRSTIILVYTCRNFAAASSLIRVSGEMEEELYVPCFLRQLRVHQQHCDNAPARQCQRSAWQRP